MVEIKNSGLIDAVKRSQQAVKKSKDNAAVIKDSGVLVLTKLSRYCGEQYINLSVVSQELIADVTEAVALILLAASKVEVPENKPEFDEIKEAHDAINEPKK